MKIFLTVGTQLPFDRLVKLVDSVIAINKDISCVGQIGESAYKPKNFEVFDNLGFEEFERCFDEADVIVSHAGMGTIISAINKSKPILICPRRSKLKEHRNDHQYSSFRRFTLLKGCYGFESKSELTNLLQSDLNVPTTNNNERDKFCARLEEYFY